MTKYNPSKIEKKWQKYWETKKIYDTKDVAKDKENYMLLTEFAYPSGNLHIGHWYAFSIPDILARYLRMQGHNVMYPTGFDAFGLPAENAAIKNNTHPEKWTKQNIAYMTKQLKSMGATFDWSREISTIDPEYYKWTQWIFLKLFEKGLAYRAQTAVNWCPKDRTVLANEQVIDGKCDRCGTQVEQKELSQWMFKITQFADALTDDMVNLDWQETAKINQKNWIGRSEGAIVNFKTKMGEDIKVFTTRPDTLYGATFLAVSPEMAQKWINAHGDLTPPEVKKYVQDSLMKTDLQRQESREKTGVDTLAKAVNPATGQEIPIWVADYVLGHYGTGAVMGVPAHDERDGEFARKFNLPVSDAPLHEKSEIMKLLKEKGAGEPYKTYRLHDWILSRQRYWGAPIPMINCPTCGYQPVPEKELPVKLPPLKDYKPADDGRSPLAKATKWLKVECPNCGGSAERETDTMDTFVDSSWYFMRYADPKNKNKFADEAKMAKWMPVPLYYGGAEHTTMHLLYSRFITKALHSLNLINFNEPFLRRINRGIILGPDNQKMSKSRGNVIDPDIEVKKFGADAVRMYLAFMGPYDQGGPWSPGGISGVYRFLNRVWNLVGRYDVKTKSSPETTKILNKYTKEIGDDIKDLKFNTGVSGLMKLLNELEARDISKNEYELLLKLLAPFAPHMAEELWQSVLKNKKSIHLEKWPECDEKLLAEEKIRLVIQVNGRVRETLEVKKGLIEDEAKRLAMESENVKKYLIGEVKKVIYVKDRIINLVV